MLIGAGAKPNYVALLLFLAGGVASGVAVYYTQIGGRWVVPTAVSLLLMLAACVLVAARREE
ncbi:MAG: hypothetical protein JOZ96_25770 [Acidobacteria bacterium]|nr:hypothetical protein [Acidobacteriota bacterium]